MEDIRKRWRFLTIELVFKVAGLWRAIEECFLSETSLSSVSQKHQVKIKAPSEHHEFRCTNFHSALFYVWDVRVSWFPTDNDNDSNGSAVWVQKLSSYSGAVMFELLSILRKNRRNCARRNIAVWNRFKDKLTESRHISKRNQNGVWIEMCLWLDWASTNNKQTCPSLKMTDLSSQYLQNYPFEIFYFWIWCSYSRGQSLSIGEWSVQKLYPGHSAHQKCTKLTHFWTKTQRKQRENDKNHECKSNCATSWAGYDKFTKKNHDSRMDCTRTAQAKQQRNSKSQDKPNIFKYHPAEFQKSSRASSMHELYACTFQFGRCERGWMHDFFIWSILSEPSIWGEKATRRGQMK